MAAKFALPEIGLPEKEFERPTKRPRHHEPATDGRASDQLEVLEQMVSFDSPMPSYPSSPGPIDALNDQPDWRELARKVLGLPVDAPDDTLAAGLSRLSRILDKSRPPPPPKLEPKFEILHRVSCIKSGYAQGHIYSDGPTLESKDDDPIDHLSGRNEITEIKRFAERTPGLCFIVVFEYQCCHGKKHANPVGQSTVMDESIYIVSESLARTLMAFQRMQANVDNVLVWPEITPHNELQNMHRWLFSKYQQLAGFGKDLDSDDQAVWTCFLSYFKTKHQEYLDASVLHQHGSTTRDSFKYLLVSVHPSCVMRPQEQFSRHLRVSLDG